MAGVDLWKWGELEWLGTRERMESIIQMAGGVVGIPLVHQLSRVLSLGVVGVVGEDLVLKCNPEFQPYL